MIFLRMVPPEVMGGVASGIYKITGSVVRDVATGRGVAFLQETGLMETILKSPMIGLVNPIAGIANFAMGAVNIGHNQQIKSQLVEVQSSLALLQNVQIGTLAVSGLGFGVSVVGFAVMLKHLEGIETHLDTIEAKIDLVTTDRRSDDRRRIFADVKTHLKSVDRLSTLKIKVSSAEAAERALGVLAGQTEDLFKQKSDAMQTGAITSADMDILWSLAAAIRLCHEARLRALYSIDELGAAKQIAQESAQSLLIISQTLTPDSLARLCAQSTQDFKAYAEARRLALPKAEVLVQGLRESVASISSQSELAHHLIENQISGPTYLEAVAAERDAPLLMLPA